MEASANVRLAGVVCPDCRGRAGTVVLEGGPVLLRHQSFHQRCRHSWVAVPNLARGTVDLLPVDGRHDGDTLLREKAAAWWSERYQAMADVFGFALPGAA
jgi:hypothetical protein